MNECPHCHKPLTDEEAVGDMSGCPKAVPCESPVGYLAPEAAWPFPDEDEAP
jgi:hypothetical protein